RPLVSANRTASRRNSGVGLFPFPIEHLLVPQLVLSTFSGQVQHWFKLGKILDYPRSDDLEKLIGEVLGQMHRGATPFEQDLAAATLRRLHAVIWTDEVINYYTETDQSVDRVLDIFVRANDGGTKLSKPDLLMSMITSKWPAGTARVEVFGFVEHINKSLPLPNAVTRDLVLKACLVLCDFDVKYSVSNFTGEAISQIEARWSAIKQAIENTFRLVNRFGISGETLTSLNAVLPIAYYLFRTPEFSFRGSIEFERVNAREMQRWLIQSLLLGVFAGSSDRTISLARGAIREGLRSDRGFPAARLYDVLATNGRIARLDARAIEDLLALEYGKAKTFLALSLLYDGLDWSAGTYHVDHIVPQARAGRRVLQGMNIPEHRIREIADSIDRLGNLQLLPGTENLEKSDLPFDAWITSRDRSYMDRHLIPDRLDLATAQMMPEFVREREKAIRQRLMRYASMVPA
ncbi:HNH endonuclease family protein, partial [Defluviimonas sp. WL0075]